MLVGLKTNKKSLQNIKIGILAGSFLQMITLGLSVTIGLMIKNFPNTDMTSLQSIVTIPSLVAIPISIITGKLVKKTGKKIPILIGIFLMALGIIPAIININLTMLYFVIGIVGIGLGLIITASTSLIPEYFHDEEQNDLMGKQSAFINLGGMIATGLAGMFATKGWRNAYFIFLLAIPVFIIVGLLIPNDKNKLAAKSEVSKHKFNKNFYIMVVLIFVFAIFHAVVNQNISILISEKNINDGVSSSETTGLLLSTMNSIAMVVGLLFGRISKFLKKNALPVGILFVATGTFIIAMTSSLIFVVMGIIMVGAGFSTVMPTGLSIITKLVPNNISASAISLFLSASNIGMFLSPYIINFIGRLFIKNSAQSRFFTSSVGLILLAIISFFYIRKSLTK